MLLDIGARQPGHRGVQFTRPQSKNTAMLWYAAISRPTWLGRRYYSVGDAWQVIFWKYGSDGADCWKGDNLLVKE